MLFTPKTAFGFGGLWRFAGPFSKSESMDNAELFVNCLEAMVETCLSIDENEAQDFEFPCTLSVSSTMNLSSSMSSLTLASQTDKELNSALDTPKNATSSNSIHSNFVNAEGKRGSLVQAQIPKQRSFKYKSSKK